MPKAEAQARKLAIDVDEERRVSGLLMLPGDAIALYVLAHGAGAGMAHPFLGTMAQALADRRVGTLRFQFPYMEAGSKRPDSPTVAHAAIRAAVRAAAEAAPGLALIAGGKSFGGRMTSQAQASKALPGVHGLAFLGFPLHPPGKSGIERADHLSDVRIPMLFLQGTRDEFADLALLRPLTKRLGKGATLHLIDDANHSFKVPAKSGRKDAEVRAELADRIAAWTAQVIGK